MRKKYWLARCVPRLRALSRKYRGTPFPPHHPLQLRDRMEPLSTTNDLARAISQFDEASVLALLKQARA